MATVPASKEFILLDFTYDSPQNSRTVFLLCFSRLFKLFKRIKFNKCINVLNWYINSPSIFPMFLSNSSTFYTFDSLECNMRYIFDRPPTIIIWIQIIYIAFFRLRSAIVHYWFIVLIDHNILHSKYLGSSAIVFNYSSWFVSNSFSFIFSSNFLTILIICSLIFSSSAFAPKSSFAFSNDMSLLLISPTFSYKIPSRI